MSLARGLLKWNYDLRRFLFGLTTPGGKHVEALLSCRNRVQIEKGAGPGLDAKRRGWPGCAMTIMVSDCSGSVCKGQSTLCVIVLSKSFAGVNNHRNSHYKRYIREHDHLVMYLPLQTSISLFSHQNTTLNTPHVTPRHADSLTAFLT